MSISVSVLASGSRGNATYVATERVRILIDCGLGRRRLEQQLRSIGEDPDRIDAVLVTHEHTDHAGGLRHLLKDYSLEAYMSCGTMDAGRVDALEMNGSAVVPVVPGRTFPIGDVEVDVFSVPHDAEEPVAFAIRYRGIKITQLTDLGWIPDDVAAAIRGSYVLILESNHDLDMLRMGPYPWALKERLLGRNGHLSNWAVSRFLEGAYDGRARHLTLAHLSPKNNHPEIARHEAHRALRKRGFEHTRVSLADQDTPSPPLELG
jgi:phosphoribosyl 1,2-cyclic phosphodiesterase